MRIILPFLVAPLVSLNNLNKHPIAAGLDICVYILIAASTIWIYIRFRFGLSHNTTALDGTKAPELITLAQEAAREAGVAFSKVEVLLAWGNVRTSPSVLQQWNRVQLVIPLGFLPLAKKSPMEARALLIHEFAHVAQRDTKLWLLASAYVRLYRVLLPYVAISAGAIAIHSLYMMNRLGALEGIADPLDMSAANGQLLSHIIVSAGGCLLLWAFFRSIRQFRRESESMADLRVVLSGHGDALREALHDYAQRTNDSSISSMHPSVSDRCRTIWGWTEALSSGEGQRAVG